MKFLIQHNLINPEHLLDIKEAIKDYPHEFVGVIPFSHEITSDEPLEGLDYIPYGSTTMITEAYRRGWTGLHYNPDTANYEAFLKHRSDMLNENVITIEEAIEFLAKEDKRKLWFTRPSNDLKEYNGVVDTARELLTRFRQTLEGATSHSKQLKPDTKIVLSKPINIKYEARFFIVNGRVITGSYYRQRGELQSRRITGPVTLLEAQRRANKWLPNSCCVMDTAKTDFGTKVIEFNCINGSGFYDCDIKAVFDALWEFHTSASNEK